MAEQQRIDITISERISLWQKSMESSIAGERAFQSLQRLQFMDTLSRQLWNPTHGEHGQIRATAYGVKDNSPPGSDIVGGRKAHLGWGTYDDPTTLAVSERWFHRGDAEGYFRSGDLVRLEGRGWWRVEDICGACSVRGGVDQWTGDTRPSQQARLDRIYNFDVFHPHETIPSTIRYEARPAEMSY